jgi:hypothetical protein
VGSWRKSLQYIGNVLRDPLLPNDLGVSVECQIPRTSKRIDVILTGQGAGGSDYAVIVELKLWERGARTSKDGIVFDDFSADDSAEPAVCFLMRMDVQIEVAFGLSRLGKV